MIRFLSDENFNEDIVNGVLRRLPVLDLVRVRDVQLTGADDPAVLAWAAQENRVLLTHDVQTAIKFAYDRIRAGLLMPGVLEVKSVLGIGQAIEEIAVVAEFATASDFEGQVRFLPL